MRAFACTGLFSNICIADAICQIKSTAVILLYPDFWKVVDFTPGKG